MPQARDLGRVYGHLTHLVAQAPLMHRAVTEELEEPFRRGRAVVVKLPWTDVYWSLNWTVWVPNAVVVGFWMRPTDIEEPEALMAALEGSVLDIDIDEISRW